MEKTPGDVGKQGQQHSRAPCARHVDKRKDACDDPAAGPHRAPHTHCLTHPAASEPSATFRGMRCGHGGLTRALDAGRGVRKSPYVLGGCVEPRGAVSGHKAPVPPAGRCSPERCVLSVVRGSGWRRLWGIHAPALGTGMTCLDSPGRARCQVNFVGRMGRRRFGSG